MVLKFGIVVEHRKKNTFLIFIFFISHVESDHDHEKIGKKHVFFALTPSLSDHNSGSTKHRKLVDGLF